MAPAFSKNEETIGWAFDSLRPHKKIFKLVQLRKGMAEKEEKLTEIKTKAVKTKQEKPEKPKSTSDLLLENFVSLQRIMADLAIKISRLNNQLSRLLDLFEEAAKNFEKEGKFEHKEGKTGIAKTGEELTNKVDRLIEQNKIIARGVSLIGRAAITREMGDEEAERADEEKEEVKTKPLPEFRF